MRVLTPHQACAVEQTDRARRDEKQRQQVPVGARLLERRRDRAHHEAEPQKETDKQKPLPETSEIDVFEALVTEPEIRIQAEALTRRIPRAGERADDDDHQTHEQQVHAEALKLRFVARHGRPDEEARREPRGRDPEDAELRVPRARDRIRNPLGERDAVEHFAFHAVVRGDGAEHDLHDDQRGHDPEIVQRGTHRRRDFHRRKRIRRGRLGRRFLMRAGAHPHERADAGEQQNKTHE